MSRTSTRLVATATLFVATAALVLAAAAGDRPPGDPSAALSDGNRLFRDGRLEAAVAAYLAGAAEGEPHPTLCYNLGTALHHLDRLPEAVLWYRRAAESGAGDPWLEDNLWLARRALGSRALPPGSVLGWLRQQAGGVRLAAVVIAWLTLLLVTVQPGIPIRAVAAAALSAAAIYGGAAAIERWGPQPAVILQACPTGAGELPAGTQAWVSPAPGGHWRISGAGDAVCPADTVALVHPPLASGAGFW